MNLFLANWKRKIASTMALTVIMIVGGLIVDPSYLNNPVGEGSLGVVAAEGYAMPATSELSLVANGVDPIQIDIKSEDGDFAGEVELISPQGKLLMSSKFALRKYPSSFMPNPSKWQTFMSRQAGPGTYLLRLTQEQPGKARAFIYQGPFIVRMLLLPLIAAFIMLVLSFTFAPRQAAVENPDPAAQA